MLTVYVPGFRVRDRKEPFEEVLPATLLFKVTDASGTFEITDKLPNAGGFGITATGGLTGFGSRTGVVVVFGGSGSLSPPPPWAKMIWPPLRNANNNVAKRRRRFINPPDRN